MPKLLARDLAKLKVFDSEQVAEGNLVFNGDFEHRTSNDGFDWRNAGAPYPIVDFAAGGAYSGSRCLQVNFTVGLNDEYLLAYQFLPLQPNSHYRLSAYVRSDSITSDSGPRLRIYDPSCRTCLDATSEGTVGTTPWHQISVAFSTGPGTQIGAPRAISFAWSILPQGHYGHLLVGRCPAEARTYNSPCRGRSVMRTFAAIDCTRLAGSCRRSALPVVAGTAD